MSDELKDIVNELKSLETAIADCEDAIQDEIANRSFLVRQWSMAAAKYNELIK